MAASNRDLCADNGADTGATHHVDGNAGFEQGAYHAHMRQTPDPATTEDKTDLGAGKKTRYAFHIVLISPAAVVVRMDLARLEPVRTPLRAFELRRLHQYKADVFCGALAAVRQFRRPQIGHIRRVRDQDTLVGITHNPPGPWAGAGAWVGVGFEQHETMVLLKVTEPGADAQGLGAARPCLRDSGKTQMLINQSTCDMNDGAVGSQCPGECGAEVREKALVTGKRQQRDRVGAGQGRRYLHGILVTTHDQLRHVHQSVGVAAQEGFDRGFLQPHEIAIPERPDRGHAWLPRDESHLPEALPFAEI